MQLHIIARGRIGRGPEADLVARYEARMRGILRVTELPDTGGKLAPAPTPTISIVLDERGQSLGSSALAQRIGRWRDDGMREARFLIGAADGHPDGVREGADLLLAFGNATWPHLLLRAMLAEQLYRAEMILAGHPYHREG